jgi:hypothetical protein
MKTPNEVLSYFIESLEQEQQFEFSMYNWFETEVEVLVTPYEVKNVCGTSACIAGTVAYRLNPKSKEHCEDTIEKWIRLPKDIEDDTDEDDFVRSSLDAIFISAILYGEKGLTEITKEQALTLLNRLLSESHETWESLYESIYKIKRDNEWTY